jgi:DNA repair protein RecO (recombination protein O)
MPRFTNCSALVLRMRATGDSNREAFFLTPESGILRCTVYGGPKSRLKAFVSPFNSGTLYLYRDPVRNSFKVHDFDVRAWRPGIRETYERTMTALSMSETILAGHGGGMEWQQTLDFTLRALDALEIADDELCKRIFVYFLKKWLDILGIKPEKENMPSSLEVAKSRYLQILTETYGRPLKSWYW